MAWVQEHLFHGPDEPAWAPSSPASFVALGDFTSLGPSLFT